ncbi:MAG: hypothetical protein HOE53_04740 [Candidatus Magasanikbacteria bacterium]|nr:hypothetical protein [Candidatus Magasanikbacteria bacterium]
MLTTRQSELLKLVVESYIGSMQPIGSRFLSENGELTVSGATIRNELRALEEAGFLTHPHTSAGRVPTEAGYQFYVENLMEETSVAAPEKEALGLIHKAHTEAQQAKELAKALVELSGCAVLVSLGQNHMYYTGMSALFAQPEFKDYARTVQISSVFDHCEDRLEDITRAAKEDVSILIGTNNPLGSGCTIVCAKLGDGKMMMLLGPMRMHYAKHKALLTHLRELLAQ